jgi:hypothetical protein
MRVISSLHSHNPNNPHNQPALADARVQCVCLSSASRFLVCFVPPSLAVLVRVHPPSLRVVAEALLAFLHHNNDNDNLKPHADPDPDPDPDPERAPLAEPRHLADPETRPPTDADAPSKRPANPPAVPTLINPPTLTSPNTASPEPATTRGSDSGSDSDSDSDSDSGGADDPLFLVAAGRGPTSTPRTELKAALAPTAASGLGNRQPPSADPHTAVAAVAAVKQAGAD